MKNTTPFSFEYLLKSEANRNTASRYFLDRDYDKHPSKTSDVDSVVEVTSCSKIWFSGVVNMCELQNVVTIGIA